MNIRDRRSIHQTADHALEQAQSDSRKILLIYLGVVTALSLAASALSVLLSNRIADTGGLGNLGLRSILSTGQAILPLVQMLILLGFKMGYCNTVLRISRGQHISQQTLYGGFRRFFPLLRATILQYFLYFALAFLCMYIGIYIFLMFPVSRQFYDLMMPLMDSASALKGTLTLDEATMIAAYRAMIPLLWIFLGLFLLVFIPMHYNFRMVTYRLIDEPYPRARLALRESRIMMHRNRFALFQLDLSFWWFYGLQLLVMVLCYGDMLLPLCGIELPFSETASYFLFLALSLALQFAVYYFAMNRVAVTYAVAYTALLPEQEAEPEVPQTPATPWQDQY